MGVHILTNSTISILVLTEDDIVDKIKNSPFGGLTEEDFAHNGRTSQVKFCYIR